MLKLSFALPVVALVLVGIPLSPVLAQQTHTVTCIAGGSPATGVDLETKIQIGPDENDPLDWLSVFGETNSAGDFIVNGIEPHASATHWIVVIHDAAFDPPEGDIFEVFYPDDSIVLEE